ncbi:MAG: DUF4340 domain-containing protein [Gammaproteobacteria bacterium]
MNNRTMIWLAGALIILAILAMIGQRGQQPQTQSGNMFLPGLLESLDDVRRVEIVGAGEERLATLERNDSGWTVLERGGYPADLTKTRHALLSLAETQILEAKTANPALHDRLGLEAITSDTAGGIAVELIGPAEPVRIIVGDAEGDYQRYVRRQGEDQTYLINRDPELATSAVDWLDTAIVNVDGERIQHVTVSRSDGEPLIVSKAVRGQANFTVENIPEGRKIRYDSIANVMGNILESLTLDDVEPLTETTDEVIVTEFRTFDGLVITARSLERDDSAWASFAAAVDPTLPPESEQTRADAAVEATEINERVQGWRYQIATYKFDQLTREIADLLQDVETEE